MNCTANERTSLPSHHSNFAYFRNHIKRKVYCTLRTWCRIRLWKSDIVIFKCGQVPPVNVRINCSIYARRLQRFLTDICFIPRLCREHFDLCSCSLYLYSIFRQDCRFNHPISYTYTCVLLSDPFKTDIILRFLGGSFAICLVNPSQWYRPYCPTHIFIKALYYIIRVSNCCHKICASTVADVTSSFVYQMSSEDYIAWIPSYCRNYDENHILVTLLIGTLNRKPHFICVCGFDVIFAYIWMSSPRMKHCTDIVQRNRGIVYY